MVIRKNAKKFAAFALAISFFSSVGIGKAVIKKDKKVLRAQHTTAQLTPAQHTTEVRIAMHNLLMVPMFVPHVLPISSSRIMLEQQLRLFSQAQFLNAPVEQEQFLNALPSQEQFSPNFSQRQLFDALLSQEQLLKSLTDVCFKKSGKK